MLGTTVPLGYCRSVAVVPFTVVASSVWLNATSTTGFVGRVTLSKAVTCGTVVNGSATTRKLPWKAFN